MAGRSQQGQPILAALHKAAMSIACPEGTGKGKSTKAGNDPKGLAKRIDALEKNKMTQDKRWDAIGDELCSLNQLVSKINEGLRERVAELEKQVAKLTKP